MAIINVEHNREENKKGAKDILQKRAFCKNIETTKNPNIPNVLDELNKSITIIGSSKTFELLEATGTQNGSNRAIRHLFSPSL